MLKVKNQNKIIKSLYYIVFIYLFFLLFLFLMQRSFIYITATPQYDLGTFPVPGLRVITVAPEEGLEITGWFVPPVRQDGPVIVFFHGNASNLGVSMMGAPYYTEQGYGFLIAEYRGYSRNPGKPTEKNLYADARSWIGFLKESGYKENQLILFGESLGSGVAVQMATEFSDVRGVVLFSPYTSLVDVAQKHYPVFPVRLFMHDKYDNTSKISDIKQPVFIVHGDKDKIVPVTQAYRLYGLANERKEMKIISGGGHNDLYIRGADKYILHFLQSLDL